MKKAHARTERPRGLGDRPRLHGHVGLLRPTDEGEALRTIHRALELGCNFLDTSDMYGPHTNERLVGGAIAGRRDEVFLATKFGIKLEPGEPASLSTRSIDGSPDYVRAACEALAGAPGRRSHRPLLPAPRRPEHADRGDGRRDGRARRSRARSATSASRRRAPRRSAARTPCTRSRPCRPSTRCGRATSRRRSCRRCNELGHRARRLLAARARLPVGALHLAGGARRERLPPLRAALHGREPASRTWSSPSACKELAAEKGHHAGAAGARVGAAPRRAHRADPRHQARVLPRGEPRRGRRRAERGRRSSGSPTAVPRGRRRRATTRAGMRSVNI